MRWALAAVCAALSCSSERATELHPEPAPASEQVGQTGQAIASGTATQPCDVEIGYRATAAGSDLSSVASYAVFDVPELTRQNLVSLVQQVELNGVDYDPCSSFESTATCETIGELPPLARILSGGGLTENGKVYVNCSVEAPVSGSATIWYKYLL